MFCPSCGKELDANQNVCPNCNCQIGVIPSEPPKNDEKKKKKRIRLLVILGVILLLFFGTVLKNSVMPAVNYSIASSALEKGNYGKAVKRYSKTLDYKDTAEKIDAAYYGYAIELTKDGQYEEALKYLNLAEKTESEEKEQYLEYLTNISDMNSGETTYSTVKYFEEHKDFEKCSELLNTAYYNYADALSKKKEYKSAIEYYKKTTGFDDVDEKIKKCEELAVVADFEKAEKYLKDGELGKALKLYKSLPEDFEHNGIKVKDRIKKLNDNSKIVKLCGSWKGKNGKFSVRQTHDSTGLWDQWDNTYTDNLEVKCVMNDDGTFTLKGTAYYYTYTNYSSLSSALKMSNYSESFSVKVKDNKIPEKIYNKDHVKITYKDNKFHLNYDYKNPNYSVNFTYRFKSSITYSKSK
jgi:tetratricopeptide (TPR) repeat protein